MIPEAPDAAPEAPATGPGARWLSGLWHQEQARLLWAMGAPVLAGGLLVAQVGLLAQVLGRMVQGEQSWAASVPWVAGIVALVLLRAVLHWTGERAASQAAERIKWRLRQALFARLLERGPQWTRLQVSGELASVLVDQVEQLDGFLMRYLPSMVAAACLPLAFGVVLLPLDWVAALILLVTAPLIPLFMALVGWGAQAASERHQQAMVRLSGRFADRLRGAFTLKLFGRIEHEVQAMDSASHDLSRKTMGVLRIAFLSSAVLEFFAALGVASIALYVGLSYLGFLQWRAEPVSLPLGLFALFMAPEVYNPLRQLAAHYHDRAAALAAVDQISAWFDGLPALAAGQARTVAADRAAGWQPVAVATPRRAVHLQGLNLAGRSAGGLLWPQALGGSLAPGEHLAVMGPSGVGKTALLETLAGLRPLLAGQVQVLDHLRAAPWGAVGPPPAPGGSVCAPGRVMPACAPHPELGKRLVLIGQQPFFLAGTIRDNLRWVAPAAQDEPIRRALRQAVAHAFVAEQPAGLDTVLGRAGHGLSGGQLR
ncbi:ABC transporter ATP-binding protein/permease, partial [Castellaniella sp.]|uniref:ABC transporter ATP-binding protein/permease n=1 Tax=Castellaniella sp. TaxID=1955812 RepID=UPI003564A666